MLTNFHFILFFQRITLEPGAMICYNNQAIAGVAQLVEQLTCNQQLRVRVPSLTQEIKASGDGDLFVPSRGGEVFFNKNLQLNRLISISTRRCTGFDRSYLFREVGEGWRVESKGLY